MPAAGHIAVTGISHLTVIIRASNFRTIEYSCHSSVLLIYRSLFDFELYYRNIFGFQSLQAILDYGDSMKVKTKEWRESS